MYTYRNHMQTMYKPYINCWLPTQSLGQAAEPWGLTAVLDPAGLRFIHDIGPAGAGGAWRKL